MLTKNMKKNKHYKRTLKKINQSFKARTMLVDIVNTTANTIQALMDWYKLAHKPETKRWIGPHVQLQARTKDNKEINIGWRYVEYHSGPQPLNGMLVDLTIDNKHLGLHTLSISDPSQE